MAPSAAPDNSPVRRVLKIAPPPTLARAEQQQEQQQQQQELKEGQPLETSRVIVLSATKGLLH
jgi:hypothetical protein